MTDPLLTQQVLDRLGRLERANRRYELALLAAGSLCFAWTACSVGPQAKNVLAAERFVLLAADGSEKATLELDSNGNPMLQLRNGQSSALLTTNGPSLRLLGQDGKTGAFVGVDSKNSSRLGLFSHRYLDGVRLSVHEDGSSGVYVLDVNGRERGALESVAAGGAALGFRDGQGRTRGYVGLDEANLPHVILLDERGGRRIGMVVQEDGNALLEVADDRSQPRLQLATLFDGSPRIELKREDGSASFQAP
jgi:hypothetical protein